MEGWRTSERTPEAWRRHVGEEVEEDLERRRSV